MRFTSETITDGVSERLFTLGDIPGVLWSPAGAAAPMPSRPLVLLAHGGGQHKKAPAMQGRARRLVTACGFAAAAIDAPGSGDRPRTEEDERFIAEIRGRMAAGEPVGPQVARYNAAATAWNEHIRTERQARRNAREVATVRAQTCPRCFASHPGEC